MRDLGADTVGLAEVAAALGRSEGWVRRHWLAIHRDHGFPRKHPTGFTWPRLAVSAWLRSGGAAPRAFEPANDVSSGVDPAAAYMAELNRHYGVEA